MKTFVLLTAMIVTFSALSPAQDATGIALWQCGGGENLQIRVVNLEYMLTLKVGAGDVSPRELAGLTRKATARWCFGWECTSAEASVHYSQSDDHHMAGDFTINLGDGKTFRDHFRVKTYVMNPCM